MKKSFNRTAYGIEIIVDQLKMFSRQRLLIAPLMELKFNMKAANLMIYPLLIAPLMELKFNNASIWSQSDETFNRTAYGIEIQ